MSNHHKINYVEFSAADLTATKQFFQQVFGWQFQDYGPAYTAFNHAGLEGGFFQSEVCSRTAQGSALIVLYSEELAQTEQAVIAAGGTIIRPIFDFPGGRRFHFLEPSGNELAVWSER